MRILSGIAILAVVVSAGCASTAGTNATATPAAAAPARGATQATASLTAADYDSIMKRVGMTNGSMRTKLMGNMLPDAAKDAQALSTLFADAERFWTQHSKADAAKWAGEARMYTSEVAGAAAGGDQMKALQSANNLLGDCKQCHGTYREMDPSGMGFRIKPGTITEQRPGRMSIDDLWYKNAVIYCLDVEKYQDANGDGVGDFEGLMRRLDYLAGLGATCVWLQPFYPSPNRDNGYDVSDYYNVHDKHGSLGDFVNFMNHADALGIRVIVDLVVNHTSIASPWFQSARASRKSFYRDWYVWADERPKNHKDGIVFPGEQTTTWSLDRTAKQYYFHRFYQHQADLNTWNPHVRAEIQKIMGFWLQLGVSGFRMDAVPFLIEKKGAHVEHTQDFTLLTEMREFLQWRSRNAILLAEANVPPEESLRYFGEEGERLQMMLNFPVNQRLFYALATADTEPLVWALEQTRKRPANAQWVQFLRSHDELDLGRLTTEQRQKVFDVFGPEPRMQLYDRGIRRRLAPMLGGNRRRLELAFSLLFSLPGTPMMQYGDEIGIGENLRLPERECARTPMQWTNDLHGGFSRARKVVRPVIDDEEYGYEKVNVAAQRRDADSLLAWTERIIRTRRECPEISWGDFVVLRSHSTAVLAIRYDWRETSLLTLHNFSNQTQKVRLTVGGRDEVLVELFDGRHSRRRNDGTHQITLEPYAWRWFRVGSADNTLDRSVLNVADDTVK